MLIICGKCFFSNKEVQQNCIDEEIQLHPQNNIVKIIRIIFYFDNYMNISK